MTRRGDSRAQDSRAQDARVLWGNGEGDQGPLIRPAAVADGGGMTATTIALEDLLAEQDDELDALTHPFWD